MRPGGPHLPETAHVASRVKPVHKEARPSGLSIKRSLKTAGENGILSSPCSGLGVHSQGGPTRGGNSTGTGLVQRSQWLSCLHVSMKFKSPPRYRGEETPGGPG